MAPNFLNKKRLCGKVLKWPTPILHGQLDMWHCDTVQIWRRVGLRTNPCYFKTALSKHPACWPRLVDFTDQGKTSIASILVELSIVKTWCVPQNIYLISKWFFILNWLFGFPPNSDLGRIVDIELGGLGGSRIGWVGGSNSILIGRPTLKVGRGPTFIGSLKIRSITFYARVFRHSPWNTGILFIASL